MATDVDPTCHRDTPISPKLVSQVQTLYPLVEPNFPGFCPWACISSCCTASCNRDIPSFDQTHMFLSQPLCSHIPCTSAMASHKQLRMHVSQLRATNNTTEVWCLNSSKPLSAMGQRMCREEAVSGCCLCLESCESRGTAKARVNLLADL